MFLLAILDAVPTTPETIEWIRTGGLAGSVFILALVVIALYRDLAKTQKECAAELKAVQAARVEEMKTVTTAAIKLAETTERIERLHLGGPK